MPRVNGGSPGKPIVASGSASGDDHGPYSRSIGMSLMVEKRALALRRPLERGIEPLGLPGAAPSGPLGRSIGHGGDSSTGVAARPAQRRRSGCRSSARRRPAPARPRRSPGRPADGRPPRRTRRRRPARRSRSTTGIWRARLASIATSDEHQRRDRAAADQPDGPWRSRNRSISWPPNASIASWIRASGRSLVMTTLTTSLGRRRPDDDGLDPLAGLRVEPVAPAARRSSAADWPVISVRAAAVGALGVEVGQRVGVRPVRPEDREDRRPLGPERPGPAGEADLGDARATPATPRFVDRAVAPGVERLGRRAPVASSGPAPRDPGRRPGRGRRPCTAPVGSNDGGGAAAAGDERERRRRAARRPTRTGPGHGRQGSRESRATPPSRGWCVLAPGTSVPVLVRPCARPSTRPNRDEGAIALVDGPGVAFCLRHPAIEPGDTWGVGHGTGNGHPLSRRFEAGDPGSGSRAE